MIRRLPNTLLGKVVKEGKADRKFLQRKKCEIHATDYTEYTKEEYSGYGRNALVSRPVPVFDMHMRSLTVLRTLAGHQDIWC